jgi:hypothetical protein
MTMKFVAYEELAADQGLVRDVISAWQARLWSKTIPTTRSSSCDCSVNLVSALAGPSSW